MELLERSRVSHAPCLESDRGSEVRGEGEMLNKEG